MIPSFVIHHPSSVDRSEIVKTLVQKTNAIVVEAYLRPDGKEGCRMSHLHVAQLASELFPNQHYLVFEDDCILSDDWMRCAQAGFQTDVLFLGYNDKSWHTVYGTHALMISPKARDLILARTEDLAPLVRDVGAYDHILSELIAQERLRVGLPSVAEKNRWAYQQPGLQSLITGHRR